MDYIAVHCSCNTQSSAPEDGRNYRPKYVELIGIINKPLLLYLVGCLYYCISDARAYRDQNHYTSFVYIVVQLQVAPCWIETLVPKSCREGRVR